MRIATLNNYFTEGGRCLVDVNLVYREHSTDNDSIKLGRLCLMELAGDTFVLIVLGRVPQLFRIRTG